MSNTRRNLRSRGTVTSQTQILTPNIPLSAPDSPAHCAPASREPIRIITGGSKLPGLTAAELSLVRQKQRQLASSASSTLASLPPGPHIRKALEASLIFSQHEAGSAVCIHPDGWVLTCSHCLGDTAEEWQANKRRWLLFHTGMAVQVECRVWDPKGALALLKIIAIESSKKDGN